MKLELFLEHSTGNLIPVEYPYQTDLVLHPNTMGGQINSVNSILLKQ